MISSKDPRHGSNRGYGAGCREACCRTAHAAYNTEKKRQRIARGIPQDVHGSPNGYTNYNCRCTPCQISMLGGSKKVKR